jgi:hypothetical protein
VIKTVAYFPFQCAQNSGPVLTAMLESLKFAGVKTIENNLDCDAVIIWSVLWHGRMSKNQAVYKHYRSQGKPVIVVDVGALYRGETWKIAVNNITADGYYGHKENLDLDRPRKLLISLALNVSKNPRIIIATQHKKSLQVSALPNMESWVAEQIEQLRQVTDRPITVRTHPRSPLQIQNLSKGVELEIPKQIPNTYDSYNLTFDCHALVNYNSGPGIQAALAGTRPIVSTSSLAHPVSIRLDALDRPYTVDRDQWLVEICHTEYTIEEIRKGLWLTRLSPAL